MAEASNTASGDAPFNTPPVTAMDVSPTSPAPGDAMDDTKKPDTQKLPYSMVVPHMRKIFTEAYWNTMSIEMQQHTIDNQAEVLVQGNEDLEKANRIAKAILEEEKRTAIFMRYTKRIYNVLPTRRHGERVMGEYFLTHNSNLGAQAYVPDFNAPDDRFHLQYAGTSGASLSSTPQLVEVNLVRANGTPALQGNYLVDTIPDMSPTSQLFVSNGKQTIPLAGCAELEPGDVIGSASSPLLRVPLDALHQFTHETDQRLQDVPGPTSSATSTDTCEDPFVGAVPDNTTNHQQPIIIPPRARSLPDTASFAVAAVLSLTLAVAWFPLGLLASAARPLFFAFVRGKPKRKVIPLAEICSSGQALHLLFKSGTRVLPQNCEAGVVTVSFFVFRWV